MWPARTDILARGVRLSMTSIRDSAKQAGASVSRVIHDSGYVSAATRARVKQAIAARAHTPNSSAQRMLPDLPVRLVVRDTTAPPR